MRVQVNGTDIEVAADATVADALEAFGSTGAGVAVAVDGSVVSRSSWASTPVSDGATLVLVTAVQGG